MQTNKSRYSKEQKQVHINDCEKSGKSKRAYCLEHNIPYYTFCSWKKLQSHAAKQFLPIEISKTSTTPFATLHFAQHITLEIHEHVQATYLQQLIACK
jgi:transposase-like protein